MQIIITNAEDTVREQVFLGAVLARVVQHQNVETATIYPTPRETRTNRSNPVGWIEYLVHIVYKDGGKLTIGCLQRQIYATVEFHT
jgi:hypothetical protein